MIVEADPFCQPMTVPVQDKEWAGVEYLLDDGDSFDQVPELGGVTTSATET